MLPNASELTAKAYPAAGASPAAGILVCVLTELVPPAAAPAAPIDPFDEPGLARLRELYAPPRPDWFRINLITSLSGSAAGSDGTSDTLTNRTDRRILGVVRGHADLVLVGAQSVRAEGYQVPRSTRLGVVTGSGDLHGHRIDPADADRVIVLCPPSSREAAAAGLPGARIVEVPAADGHLPAADVLAALHELGLRSLVCEGGPSLAAQFAAAGLVDELCLTTAPQLTGTTLPALGERAFTPTAFRLERLLLDEASTLYARWLRTAEIPESASQSPIAAS